MTRRRLLLALLALAACLCPFGMPNVAAAEQEVLPRHIGVLQGGSWSEEWVQAFRRGLLDAGYAEGRDIVIEWRPANGNYDLVPHLADDLVQSKVDVIVADGTVATRAAKRASSILPIVMVGVADPVGSGLVANLAHPGGNVTVLTIMTADLTTKRLQLLKETIPELIRVAVLWNPDAPYSLKVIDELKAVAPSLSIKLKLVGVRTPEEISPTFSVVSRAHAQALFIIEDGFFLTHRTKLLKLASQARLPSMSAQREYVDVGGLMSYGPRVGDLFRRAAGYVGKILRGAKPSDLPVEQPTQFELVVNLKTAKAIGLALPQAILDRADEVIR